MKTNQAQSRDFVHPDHRLALFPILLTLLFGLVQGLDWVRSIHRPAHPVQQSLTLSGKPVLTYFVLTSSLAEVMIVEVGLPPAHVAELERIADLERVRLRSLELESLPIIHNLDLSLAQKRILIANLHYNQRIREIIQESQSAVLAAFGPINYLRLVRWMEHRWVLERRLHGSPASNASPRTYKIYATRYDAKGAYRVALPDQCLKFANGGNHICDDDGYVAGAGYTVFLSYEKSTAAVVGESGPWNIDDNYWATRSDPTPRRMFADLALGMPEAQAAYFNGYNGGVDQFGRVVTAPFGIDLAREVSIDIGLEPGNNDWINISFMWTEGWDGGSGVQPPKPGETALPQPTLATIIPIEIASPNPDGSVRHTVQEGQNLWNIAAAYQVEIPTILSLNGMTDGSTIFPGQKLLIKPPIQPTATPDDPFTPKPTGTVEPSKTRTARSATAQPPGRQTPSPETGVEATPHSPSPTSQPPPVDSEIDPVLIGIIGFGLAGAGLFILGQWLTRKP